MDLRTSSPVRQTKARSVRAYVSLLRLWIRRDLDARYRRSALKTLWAALQPFATLAVYAFIFGVIFDQAGGSIPYVTYLLSGMLVYRVVVGALNLHTGFVDNLDLLGHSRFPREMIPLSQVAGVAIELVITVPGLVVIAAVQGISPPPTLVALPLVLVSIVTLATWVCILASTVNVFVGDLRFVIPFVSTALFFASPISYTPEQLPEWLQWLNSANPITVALDALRAVVLLGEWPTWPLFLAHFAGALVLLAGVIAHLRSVEHRFVDTA